MSESRWLRLNTDWHLSDWLVVLSAESRLAWVQLLCHVKINGFAGRCKAVAPMVAERLWFVNEPSIRQMLQAAEKAGALLVTDGVWEIAKWRDYQGDDTHAERQKRYRERKSQVQKSQKVTDGDASETKVTLTETETKTETIKKKLKKKIPPDISEVCDYATSRGYDQEEAEKFFDHHSTRGWEIGKNQAPMRDWEAAWRTWERNLRKYVAHKSKSGIETIPGDVWDQAEAIISARGAR